MEVKPLPLPGGRLATRPGLAACCCACCRCCHCCRCLSVCRVPQSVWQLGAMWGWVVVIVVIVIAPHDADVAAVAWAALMAGGFAAVVFATQNARLLAATGDEMSPPSPPSFDPGSFWAAWRRVAATKGSILAEALI